jgi:hypothetical protein
MVVAGGERGERMRDGEERLGWGGVETRRYKTVSKCRTVVSLLASVPVDDSGPGMQTIMACPFFSSQERHIGDTGVCLECTCAPPARVLRGLVVAGG